jgi:hypothetical protein
MEDNRLLTVVSLLERVKLKLKADRRDQLNKTELEGICRTIDQALELIMEADICIVYATAYLVDAAELTSLCVKDESFMETSSELKDSIVDKIYSGCGELYLEVGKYYTKHDFNFDIRLERLLRKIVDECIERDYYFGLDSKEEVIL